MEKILKKDSKNRIIQRIAEYQKDVTVNNPTGLHARPASMVVKKAKESEAKITILSTVPRRPPLFEEKRSL
ncbi:MAG: HPr family phosphocarrier protein [Flavobacterium sp.]